MSRPPVLVIALAAAFLLLVAALLIGSFTKPEFPPYTLTTPRLSSVGDSLVGPATYTLDASAGDRWRRFDFGRNAALDSGEGEGEGEGGAWDIAFRRHHVIAAPGAGVADLGAVAFDSVREVPDTGYAATELRGDTVNAGVGKWYTYSMLSHLLTSKRHVYAVRTADGRYAKLEILAYYCRDVGAACYTFRYAFQGGGGRRVAK
ncbi:MAG TPA: HmuY family protein [Gemmatimonadales bacterium]|nr:HmuY family protein [Gemmatimonadales bacterium]